jgi:cytochrome-b5 reductase
MLRRLSFAVLPLGAYLGWKCSREELQAKDYCFSAKLQDHWDISPDVRMFRLALPNANQMFIVPTTSTVEMQFPDGYSRQYTPVNPNGTKGYFDILIKRYPGGKCTDGYLWKLVNGDSIRCCLRNLHMKYTPNQFENIGMLCAGVGITPVLQIIRDVVTNPYDKTMCHLLYVNREEGDILLREELDRLQAQYPDKLRVTHSLTNPSSEWKGLIGGVTNDSIASAFKFKGGSQSIIYACGPDGWIEETVTAKVNREMRQCRHQPIRPVMLRGSLAHFDTAPGCDVYCF